MASGIYCISNNINGKCYIGQAVDFNRRWTYHRYLLKKGNHHCRHLQSAWKKYGSSSFVFFSLEEVELSQLTSSEQFWMDYFRFLGTTLYNTAAGSASPRLGIRGGGKSREAIEKTLATKLRNGTTGKGKVISQETIEKTLATRRERGITNKGRKHTPEECAKMRGRKKSSESIAKRLETIRRNGTSNTGRKQTPEAVAKRVETRRQNREAKRLQRDTEKV